LPISIQDLQAVEKDFPVACLNFPFFSYFQSLIVLPVLGLLKDATKRRRLDYVICIAYINIRCYLGACTNVLITSNSWINVWFKISLIDFIRVIYHDLPCDLHLKVGAKMSRKAGNTVSSSPPCLQHSVPLSGPEHRVGDGFSKLF